MKVVHTVKEVRDIVKGWKKEGLSVGFVPTMGFLHEGHKSLILKSVKENDKTVVSVFVNPTQFGPTEDLDKYPRDLEHDTELVTSAGADLIFNPSPAEMYPNHFTTTVNTTEVSEFLCGAKRPVHFGGVCLVLTKLFNIVQPNKAYFGQKDAQQLAVVKRFVRDLNFDIEIIGCPIVRETDGLAKSSRNTYLSPEERKAATILYKSLCAGKALIENGERNSEKVKDAIRNVLNTEPLAKVDYVEVVDNTNIQPIDTIKGEVLVAIAVYIGTTREIDNFIIEV